LGYSIVQTVDGGFAIAGQNASYKPFEPHSGPTDWQNFTVMLIKTDAEGDVAWEKTYETQIGYGISSSDAAVIQTGDLGYALCRDEWFLKLNTEGIVEWTKTFDNLEHCKAIQTSDDGYALIGNTKAVKASSSVNSILIKTDANGDILWTKNFSSALPYRNDVVATALAETSDNGYVIVGSWHGVFWFAKTDYNGNLLFNQTYGLSSTVGGAGFTSLSKTMDDGYIFAGSDYNPTQEVSYSGWIFKTDSQGNTQWNYHFQLPGFGALFRSITQTADGGYIAVGSPVLVKLDSSGNLEWNTTGYDAYSVVAIENGGFAVAGGQGDLISFNQELWAAKFAVTESALPSISDLYLAIAVAGLLLSVIIVIASVVLIKKRGRRWHKVTINVASSKQQSPE